MQSEEIIITPIGYVHSDQVNRYETPRQGVLAKGNISTIELLPNNNFEQALKNLNGFDRIWVLYQFHLNANPPNSKTGWKPLVTPPRHTREKIGVFATRAPYRPNHIGMSSVKLEKVEGLKIFISESDILNGSPVLDIKPYLPYSDSFPDAATGWVKSGLENIYEVIFSKNTMEQAGWLQDNAKINLVNFARLQLEFNPTDATRKRIIQLEHKTSSVKKKFILAYRTWRIFYQVDEAKKKVSVKEIFSGYTKEEMLNLAMDIYEDKKLHKMFNEKFNHQ
ncbi:MAG: tRNA (N6-threonylcarbamoyladenosine(37)-N6)-methyltransferase TrmO [Ignavibacteriaceae bacterium]|jgi:tRNA-Thr(GGU) m(6)t(6)A37 methyltransferase TsaA